MIFFVALLYVGVCDKKYYTFETRQIKRHKEENFRLFVYGMYVT